MENAKIYDELFELYQKRRIFDAVARMQSLIEKNVDLGPRQSALYTKIHEEHRKLDKLITLHSNAMLWSLDINKTKKQSIESEFASDNTSLFCVHAVWEFDFKHLLLLLLDKNLYKTWMLSIDTITDCTTDDDALTPAEVLGITMSNSWSLFDKLGVKKSTFCVQRTCFVQQNDKHHVYVLFEDKQRQNANSEIGKILFIIPIHTHKNAQKRIRILVHHHKSMNIVYKHMYKDLFSHVIRTLMHESSKLALTAFTDSKIPTAFDRIEKKKYLPDILKSL